MEVQWCQCNAVQTNERTCYRENTIKIVDSLIIMFVNHHHAVSASRAKSLSTRQVSDANNRSEILRYDPMQHLECQHGDLIDDALQEA